MKKKLKKNWKKILSNPDVIIIDGNCYHSKLETDPDIRRGFRGMPFKINRFGVTPWYSVKNLWYDGRVPSRFRKLHPDNAEFIGEKPDLGMLNPNWNKHQGYGLWSKPTTVNQKERVCPLTLENFVRDYSGMVKNTIRRLGVHNEQDVQDIEQDVYLRFATTKSRRIEWWDSSGPKLTTYIFPVIRSVVYNFKNKQMKRIVDRETVYADTKELLVQKLNTMGIEFDKKKIRFNAKKRSYYYADVPVFYREVDLTFRDTQGNEYVNPEVDNAYLIEGIEKSPTIAIFLDRLFLELGKKAPWTSESHRGKSTKSMTLVVQMLKDEWTPTEIANYFQVAPQTFTIWRRYIKKVARKLGMDVK